MTTLTQCLNRQTTKIKKQNIRRSRRLRGNPFGKGLVVRSVTMTPKKPNSAIRKVAKVKLNRKPRVTARITGSGYGLVRFNRVLVRGGRANDLPCVGYTVVRGKWDSVGLNYKKRKRSKYGVKRPQHKIKYVRKKVRRNRIRFNY